MRGKLLTIPERLFLAAVITFSLNIFWGVYTSSMPRQPLTPVSQRALQNFMSAKLQMGQGLLQRLLPPWSMGG
ncbi:hypothetical protein DO97_07810 [Neosynechococcus sphagnicola sy1]|uniref:Uncharacterized protein n=1 Tax=Neosynechococcus sphagnicola sy1 TaxID=1497020 RepID=A0A098TJU3_9CYAN|nr:hypothetical protein [Neosynechococcus sphagnicola]KGF72569.1 hypothetical protein DO97_07810 [Neosynechococcus sphagnicola sy1]